MTEATHLERLSIAAAEALVGHDLGVSEWLLIDQAMVDTFADATNDHQFIHTSPDAARAVGLAGTIAHGFLTLSLVAGLKPPRALALENARLGLNYGFDRLRFLAPVLVGSRIRVRHVLRRFEPRGVNRWLAATEITVEIEGQDRPALVADWLVLHEIG